MGKLLADQAAVGGKAMTMTHIDSWEVGSQNWTAGFREEFQKRCGYDLFTYFPVLTGRVVERRKSLSAFSGTCAAWSCDLVIENYAGHMRELCHQHGLTFRLRATAPGRWMKFPTRRAPMCR